MDDTFMGELGRRLILMAKEPVPGRVKTRLAPALDAREACVLYRAMLEDSIHQARSSGHRARVELHVHPAEAVDGLAAAFPGLSVRPQRGEDLAERMETAVRTALESGASTVVLRNTDSPDLPARLVRRAFEVLEGGDADFVIGPDLGGGYYLAGQRSLHPGLFGEARMSVGDNRIRTVEAARRRGLRVAELDPWPDVDRPEDLARLADTLRAEPATAPATYRALRALGRLRGPEPRSEETPGG